MKSRRRLLLAVVMTGTLVPESPACGPYFPVSYFPSEAETGKVTCAYCVSPHLGTELGMIGAHYYPEVPRAISVADAP